MSRGLTKSEAYSSTLKPGGACGQVFGGRVTIFGKFDTNSLALGGGKSPTPILWIVPGASPRKSVNGLWLEFTSWGVTPRFRKRTDTPISSAKPSNIRIASRFAILLFLARNISFAGPVPRQIAVAGVCSSYDDLQQNAWCR
jgi:hypothetical protein